VRWRYNYNDNSPYWTAKSPPPRSWYNCNVDLSFVVEAGRRGSIVNKNAKLIVKKKTKVDGKTVTEVLTEKEFTSSWWAKLMVDSLLSITSQMFRTQEEAEAFVINTLKNAKDADKPVSDLSAINYNNGRGWYC
jgi:hypothetical protein